MINVFVISSLSLIMIHNTGILWKYHTHTHTHAGRPTDSFVTVSGHFPLNMLMDKQSDQMDQTKVHSN